MKDINYAKLYGVKSNEEDFEGVARRAAEEGPRHLDKFVKLLEND